MTSCSVLIVTYHTGPVLFACVKSVLRQNALAEVVIVDNGNPPDVLARLQQMKLTEPRLNVLTGQGNIGFARACNLAAKHATGDFLLLLNPECLLPPEALSDMMAAFSEFPEAMLAGCWLQNPDGKEEKDGRRRLLTPPQALAESLGLQRFFRPPPIPVESDTHMVPAISGTFMCVRRTDYQRLLGLDETFFLFGASLDFCVRVRKAGGRIICVPRVRVTHMPAFTSPQNARYLEWQKARGTMRYFQKHFRGRYVPGLMLVGDAGLLLRLVLNVLKLEIKRLGRRKPVLSHSVAAKKLMVLASGLSELPETRDLHGKTVLVTGATWQVGLCVIRRLLASGAAVLAISRFEAIPFRHERLRWIQGDLTDNQLHLQDYLVDMVVHCAPLWHLPPTISMLEKAEVRRVVAFGSTTVFARMMSKNDFERDMVDKLSKAEAETASQCEARGMRWTILRPTMVYGVGLDLGITSLAKFIRRWGFFPVYPPAFGRRQPVHADDLALAVMQVLAEDATCNTSYNVSGGEILTYRTMLERLFGLLRMKMRIIPTTVLPFALDLAGWISRKKHINGEIARRMNDDLVFFHDDATRDFNYAPRPFLSGGLKDIEGF